ncbi:hypothetical protein ABH926_003192 [Catenulispora sp. GP43]|uniref:hypothetical protein n=1 Tax=Catenulispora sp. GP43 TaxID=3156263 RepID=UPI0035136082
MLNPGVLDGEAASLFADGWTRSLRSLTDISLLPEDGTEKANLLAVIAEQLERYSLLPVPSACRPEFADPAVLAALATEARDAADPTDAGPAGQAFLDSSALREMLAKEYGLEISSEPQGYVNASYLVFDSESPGLEFQLVPRSEEDISILLCLDRVDSRPPEEASASVVATPSGLRRFRTEPGECLVLDPGFTVHGHTPVVDGERVVCLRAGFRIAR